MINKTTKIASTAILHILKSELDGIIGWYVFFAPNLQVFMLATQGSNFNYFKMAIFLPKSVFVAVKSLLNQYP
jgi:hypothetical protein